MDADTAKAILMKRRAELDAELHQIDDALDQTPSKDWEDRAAERQGDEVLEAKGQSDLNALRRIDAALSRIEDGSYGVCVKCGNDISAARLDLLPDTPLCKTCAV